MESAPIAKKKKMRVCLAASAGGHMAQLLKFARILSDYETFVITTSSTVQKKLREYGRVYVVGECNRKRLIRVITVLFRTIQIILREKPDVVISTGAAVGCIACFLGRLIGAKVVWIDSITNVQWISLSGRMVRYVADLFLVQWPDLADKYAKAEYAGSLYDFSNGGNPVSL